MHADHYFEKGFIHDVCQDFAVSGENNDIVYAVIADGCSSSPNSDIGARILAQAFIQDAMVFNTDIGNETKDSQPPVIEQCVTTRLRNVRKDLGLEIWNLDATVVAAIFSKRDNALRVYMWGDGNIVLKYPDRLERWEGYYPHNAPYYLSYRLSMTRTLEYADTFKDTQLRLTKTVIEDIEDHKQTIKLPPEIHDTFYAKPNLEGLEWVAVMSDGIDSYSIGATEEKFDAFSQAVAYKSLNGEFVQRRMKRFRQDMDKVGNTHYDDVAVASIAFI